MRSASPADTEVQFRVSSSQPPASTAATWGAPRSAHGPDWTCPARPAHVAVILLPLGILLTVGGLMLPVTAGPDQGKALAMATMAAVVIGITLLIAGAIAALRRR